MCWSKYRPNRVKPLKKKKNSLVLRYLTTLVTSQQNLVGHVPDSPSPSSLVGHVKRPHKLSLTSHYWICLSIS